MTTPRQRPISIGSRDRQVLDDQKRRYEQSMGESSDWGNFLGTMVLLGLAAAGVYALARATRRTPQSVDIECVQCGGAFIMAVPQGTGRAVYTTCPHCTEELVVDLGRSR